MSKVNQIVSWDFAWHPPSRLTVELRVFKAQEGLVVPEAEDVRLLWTQLMTRFGDSAEDRILVEGSFSNRGGLWISDTRGLLFKPEEPDDDDSD